MDFFLKTLEELQFTTTSSCEAQTSFGLTGCLGGGMKYRRSIGCLLFPNYKATGFCIAALLTKLLQNNEKILEKLWRGEDDDKELKRALGPLSVTRFPVIANSLEQAPHPFLQCCKKFRAVCRGLRARAEAVCFNRYRWKVEMDTVVAALFRPFGALALVGLPPVLSTFYALSVDSPKRARQTGENSAATYAATTVNLSVQIKSARWKWTNAGASGVYWLVLTGAP